MKPRPLAASLVCLALAAGCASSQGGVPHDPLERVNRGTFWFNEQLDRFLLAPVARGYDFVVPERAQRCVRNFFENLRFPVRVTNDLLQAKWRQAGMDTGRFGVNTTVGLVGLFDPADGWGLPPGNEDFGQTLGHWGLGPGPYLVLPLLGPSGLRDAAAIPVDGALNVAPYLVESSVTLAANGLQLVNRRAAYLEAVDENRAMAFDYYVFVRDAYRSLRKNLVMDGESMPSHDEEQDLYFPETP